MRRTFSDSLVPLLIGAAVAGAPVAARAQEPGGAILSSDISVSREAAELRLELQDGRELSLELAEDGAVRLNGDRIGAYERRDGLDEAWRSLLQRAMDAPASTLPGLLRDWSPPADAGGIAARLDRELEAAMASVPIPAQNAAASQEDAGAVSNVSDSISLLNERIRQLERLIEDPNIDPAEAADLPVLRELRMDLEADLREEIRQELRSEIQGNIRFDRWNNPLRHITRGIAGVFSTLMVYAIMVGVGFLAVFFGRKYLEGIADTARHATLRSGLVGLAGGFLVAPAFILGTLALAISIVGIPLLLVWLPGFWVAAVLAAVGGFLGVAHGAGEAFAERRFTGTEWFTRANSYYYVMTGMGLLLVLYLAASVVGMAGPWLGFIEGLLRFMAVMISVIAGLIGFGAVLISRGGTRPVRGTLSTDPDLGGE